MHYVITNAMEPLKVAGGMFVLQKTPYGYGFEVSRPAEATHFANVANNAGLDARLVDADGNPCEVVMVDVPVTTYNKEEVFRAIERKPVEPQVEPEDDQESVAETDIAEEPKRRGRPRR